MRQSRWPKATQYCDPRELTACCLKTSNAQNFRICEKCKQNCLHPHMSSKYEKYKGIHPGKVLEQELKKRNISQRPFAQSIEEHPQSLNAILKG